MKTILVAGNTSELGKLVECALRLPGVRIEFTEGQRDALQRIAVDKHKYSLLLLDLGSDSSGYFDVLEAVENPLWPLRTIVLCSAPHQIEQVGKFRGCDILRKPIPLGDLMTALTEALDSVVDQSDSFPEMMHSNAGPQDDLPSTGTWSQRIESLLLRVAASNVPVLLQGETGVGKEVIARRLHALSRRADRRFIKLNCAALPSELVESELFGYERGAFTGAFKNTPGKFEMANKGTILLDEIGDMDFRLQAKLLQVLQDNEFYRLGAHEASRIDVRIMAASHCDFEKAIAERKFREDLYYRLNVVDIKIPPLRDRRSEILPLSELFLQKHATTEWPKLEIDPVLRQVLLEYSWPGNVRELENAMRKYLVLRNPGVLAAEIRQRTVKTKSVYPPGDEYASSNGNLGGLDEPAPSKWGSDSMRRRAEAGTSGTEASMHRVPWAREMSKVQELPRPTLVSRSPSIPPQEAQPSLSKVNEAIKLAETEAILAALQSSLWNRKRAAILLNIDYKALLYKMKKLGIGEKHAVSCG
jgi:DNA-binding NtrC family response regulator